MQGRRRAGAGRLAAGAVVVGACVLALAGCSLFGPHPEPTSLLAPDGVGGGSDGAHLDPAAQETLLPQLDTYGLWSPTWDSPPGVGDLDRPAPVPVGFDPNRRIWLTSIFLAPGVSGEVSILKPQDARLFVSTWDRWGSLSATELLLGSTRSVHLVGCEGYASYPGLTIVDGAECVVFAVQQDGDDRVGQISVPFFGADC